MSESHTPGPWKDLAPGTVNIKVPPNFLALMSGCMEARQDEHGAIRLTYTDGTTESAPCPDLELTAINSFFEVVGTVQARAAIAQATEEKPTPTA